MRDKADCKIMYDGILSRHEGGTLGWGAGGLARVVCRGAEGYIAICPFARCRAPQPQTGLGSWKVWIRNMYVCMYVCVYVYIYIYIYDTINIYI